MDKLKNQKVTEKSIRLLQQNYYTFEVDAKLTKTEMKNWVEQFFNVEVKGTNSSRIPKKKKKTSNLKLNTMGPKKMIVQLKEKYSIPLFLSQN
ncbi:hypothetical protein KP509_05G042800 [Ceratopteris richardii]|uniref:Large ribosomal subunit protein uL23c n=2 Tax=Ceratopteris TaxID=29595 RepID=A0A097A087_CERRI|nr:ribosomal protein L23 [Pteris vittata]YP_010328084.1 ribosomal protein L23 [Ceratopteris thalictroides]YP_010487983.1 ribosomal protein L23 [Ceratopteris pteridoides]AIS38281.1 ribosomal protein L23 [Ceratopteris richardii]AYW14732.1 ribosomal protein L23 [Ceratopteris cornuta]KAH7436909.1 hypothetical protein KP509_05G042800 [Ceratopteris richardii]UJH19149.1 ribosomal protein L23 [Ceratopteris thalictroides]UWI72085.1 ribosomal protein L23 [Ceratopteris pteridoides]